MFPPARERIEGILGGVLCTETSPQPFAENLFMSSLHLGSNRPVELVKFSMPK